MLLVCQSVGSRSNSFTVRFSVTRFVENAKCPVRPLEYRCVRTASNECALITPSGWSRYVRLFMCGNARRRRCRWMVVDVVKSCDPSNR